MSHGARIPPDPGLGNAFAHGAEVRAKAVRARRTTEETELVRPIGRSRKESEM